MSHLLRFNARFWPALTLALLTVVTGLSLVPLAELPLPGAGQDKLQHLVAYGALAFPVALARPSRWAMMLAGLAAWSGVIELLQPLVNRSASVFDLAANVAGILMAVAGATLLRRVAAAA